MKKYRMKMWPPGKPLPGPILMNPADTLTIKLESYSTGIFHSTTFHPVELTQFQFDYWEELDENDNVVVTQT